MQEFRDLEVYQKAETLVRDIFRSDKDFPKEETYSLTDPVETIFTIYRCTNCRSVGKRRYERHFVSKLNRRGCRTNGNAALDDEALDMPGYLRYAQTERLIKGLSELGRMLKLNDGKS